jgi:hypothetical protein
LCIKYLFELFHARNFQTFDTSAQQQQQQQTPQQPPITNYGMPNYGNQSYFDPTPSMYGQSDLGQPKAYTGNEFDDEPPLLEGT